MSMLTVVSHISRATGGNLSLENPGSYSIVAVNMGDVSWRRSVAKSDYQHGEFLVGAVKDVIASGLTVRAYGSSASDLETKTAALLRAFEQFSYNVYLSIDGAAHEWVCEPANYVQADGQGLDKFAIASLQQVYKFQFPRSPVAVSGAF